LKRLSENKKLSNAIMRSYRDRSCLWILQFMNSKLIKVVINMPRLMLNK